MSASKLRRCTSAQALKDIQQYAADGLSEKVIASKLGVSQDSFTRYKQANADIADAIKKGQEEYRNKRVQTAEQALQDRIVGHWAIEKEYTTDADGNILGVIKVKEKWIEPSDTAIIFALKKLKPSVYSDIANAGDRDADVEDSEAYYEAAGMGREIDPLSAAVYELERQAKEHIALDNALQSD